MESLLIAFIFIMLIAGIATRKTTSSEPDRTYRPETVENMATLQSYSNALQRILG